MNHIKQLSACVMAGLVVILVAGCVSSPRTGAGTLPASCTLLSRSELWQYATDNRENPFIAPTGFVRGTPNEFAVVQLNLSLPEATRVQVEGSLAGPDGTPVAQLRSLAAMQQYWSDWGMDRSERPGRKLLNTLERYYAPKPDFTARAGNHEYLLVFIGKHPIPRPATVTLSVRLGDGEPQPFTFDLPDTK